MKTEIKFYIDKAIYKRKNGKKLYAHLITSGSIEDLHEFASSLGIKKHFFDGNKKHPHYDVNEEQRLSAIAHGAVISSSKELIKIIKNK